MEIDRLSFTVFFHYLLSFSLTNFIEHTLFYSLTLIYLLTHTQSLPLPLYQQFSFSFSLPGGLDLATRLLKEVVEEIKSSRPNITYYSTLSPIPGFRNWVKKLQQVRWIYVRCSAIWCSHPVYLFVNVFVFDLFVYSSYHIPKFLSFLWMDHHLLLEEGATKF